MQERKTDTSVEEELRVQLVGPGGIERYVEEGRPPLFVDQGVNKPDSVLDL